jgi:hypothetical protein
VAIASPLTHHTAWIMDRGGKRRIHQVKGLGLCRWERLRDDISSATVQLTGDLSSSQERILNSLEPGRHELCIYRDRVRSWEGPLGLLTFGRDSVEINAKDVMYYAYRTAMHAGYDSSYPNTEYVTTRAKRVLIAELARKEALDPPVNILPYLVEHTPLTGDARTSAVTQPYQYTVFEHLDSLAANNGMDYTVIGRAIHLWDTSRMAMGQTRTVTENDFLGEVYVSVYGAELATSATVTDGNGAFATAGAIDPFYGEWERLATAYDESDGATPPTSAELQSQASRNQSGRNPTPLQVRVPDNSSLNPRGVLSVDDLVPGVYVPLLTNLNIRKVSQMQKLHSVKFEEIPTGETISVTFTPASKEAIVVE